MEGRARGDRPDLRGDRHRRLRASGEHVRCAGRRDGLLLHRQGRVRHHSVDRGEAHPRRGVAGSGSAKRRSSSRIIRQRCDKDGNACTQAGNDTQSDYKIVRADTGKSVPASDVPKGERLIAPESGRIDRAERRRMSRSGRSGERVRDGAGGAFSASGASAPGTTTPPTTTTHRCWVCE